jgi:quinol monooxygenase YgiN
MTKQAVVRVSKGYFEAEDFAAVERLIAESAAALVPAIEALAGLLYYHAGVDADGNTVVNVSIWESMTAAGQMETLAPMLSQRPVLEAAGVRFDRIANYEAVWSIGRR